MMRYRGDYTTDVVWDMCDSSLVAAYTILSLSSPLPTITGCTKCSTEGDMYS